MFPIMSTAMQCRDTFGYFNSSVFQMWTCSMCYAYLFQDVGILRPNWNKEHPQLIYNSTGSNYSVNPDVNDEGQVTAICSYLDTTNCERWKECCFAAISCCDRQISNSFTSHDSQCPATWDGFGCLDSTKPGEISTVPCPEFIEYGFSSGYARKTCTENATWWIDSVTNREWTDYTPCLNLKIYKSLVYVGVTCSSISLLLLIPACIAFISLRQLKSQHRIRVHTCLFVSFIMTCVATILWDLLIYNDRLDNPATTTRMHKNTIFCRILYGINRYCRTCNFFWMFCEGFYLHRLLIQAFKVPKTLKWYYLIGWVSQTFFTLLHCILHEGSNSFQLRTLFFHEVGGPLIPIFVYVIVRLKIADYDCWVKNIGIYEWILYIPNLLCILLNLIFLCSILRILLTRLQCHPNEPSNYRRGLKATFLLVPLFGIQLFLITYRPSSENVHRLLYEIISKLVIDSQGAIVSLIFFYINAEVHLSLQHRFRDLDIKIPCLMKNGLPPNVSNTHRSSLNHSSNRNSYMGPRKSADEIKHGSNRNPYKGPRTRTSTDVNGDVNAYVF